MGMLLRLRGPYTPSAPAGSGASKNVAPAKVKAQAPSAGGCSISTSAAGAGCGSATSTLCSHSSGPEDVPAASTGPPGEAATVKAQPAGERGAYLRGVGGGSKVKIEAGASFPSALAHSQRHCCCARGHAHRHAR